MIVDVHTKCRVCKKELACKTADINTHEAMKCADAWKPLLTCNRCFDFKLAYDNALERLGSICFGLHNKVGDPEKLVESLANRARAMCQVFENQYFLPELFNLDFLDILRDHPIRFTKIVQGLHSQAKRLNRERSKP